MKKIIRAIFISSMIFNIDVNARTKQNENTIISLSNRFSQIADKLRDSLKRKSMDQYNYYAFMSNNIEVPRLNKRIKDVLMQCKNDKQIKKYGVLIDVFLRGNANRILVTGKSLTELFSEYFKNIKNTELRRDIAIEILNYKILQLFYEKLSGFAGNCYTVSNNGSVSDFCNMIIDNVLRENVPDVQVSHIKAVNKMVALIAKIMTLYRNFAIVASQLTNKGTVVLSGKPILVNISALLSISDQDLILKIETLLQNKLTQSGEYTKDTIDEYTTHDGRKLLQERILEQVVKYQEKVAERYKG